MQVNWLVQLVAALVPMIVGMVWYNPKVFGNAWMQAAGMTEEKIKGANMPVIYGISLVMAFLFGLAYKVFADHGTMFDALFRPIAEHGAGIDVAGAFGTELKDHVDAYVARYSSWTHGLAHSVILSIIVILPIIVTNALFERKSFKYMMMNFGYWAVTLALMFMVVAQFS